MTGYSGTGYLRIKSPGQRARETASRCPVGRGPAPTNAGLDGEPAVAAPPVAADDLPTGDEFEVTLPKSKRPIYTRRRTNI